MPRNINHYGATEADVPALAQHAGEQWTARFNPRPVSQADFEAMYHAALKA